MRAFLLFLFIAIFVLLAAQPAGFSVLSAKKTAARDMVEISALLSSENDPGFCPLSGKGCGKSISN